MLTTCPSRSNHSQTWSNENYFSIEYALKEERTKRVSSFVSALVRCVELTEEEEKERGQAMEWWVWSALRSRCPLGPSARPFYNAHYPIISMVCSLEKEIKRSRCEKKFHLARLVGEHELVQPCTVVANCTTESVMAQPER